MAVSSLMGIISCGTEATFPDATVCTICIVTKVVVAYRHWREEEDEKKKECLVACHDKGQQRSNMCVLVAEHSIKDLSSYSLMLIACYNTISQVLEKSGVHKEKKQSVKQYG